VSHQRLEDIDHVEPPWWRAPRRSLRRYSTWTKWFTTLVLTTVAMLWLSAIFIWRAISAARVGDPPLGANAWQDWCLVLATLLVLLAWVVHLRRRADSTLDDA
jgi:hypothetical protein